MNLFYEIFCEIYYIILYEVSLNDLF